MPTLIELERPAAPDNLKYWLISAPNLAAACAEFARRYPHYAPDKVYHYGNLYYFPMEWKR